MNRAKIYSNRRGIRSVQRSSSKWCSESYLPKAEGQLVIVDIRRLQVCRVAQGQFYRPYPYTEGDNSDGHEEHERESATDGPPVR